MKNVTVTIKSNEGDVRTISYETDTNEVDGCIFDEALTFVHMRDGMSDEEFDEVGELLDRTISTKNVLTESIVEYTDEAGSYVVMV